MMEAHVRGVLSVFKLVLLPLQFVYDTISHDNANMKWPIGQDAEANHPYVKLNS